MITSVWLGLARLQAGTGITGPVLKEPEMAQGCRVVCGEAGSGEGSVCMQGGYQSLSTHSQLITNTWGTWRPRTGWEGHL